LKSVFSNTGSRGPLYISHVPRLMIIIYNVHIYTTFAVSYISAGDMLFFSSNTTVTVKCHFFPKYRNSNFWVFSWHCFQSNSSTPFYILPICEVFSIIV